MNESRDQPSRADAERQPLVRHVLDLSRSERRRRVLISAIRTLTTTLTLLVLFYLLPLDWSPAIQVTSAVTTGVVLIGGAGIWQLRAVANAEFPELRAIEALAFSTTLLIVLFASVYLALSHDDPNAFSEQLDHTGGLYLTLMTLTTVGFGDISALSQGARIAVIFQMVVNFAVLGVGIKLIVGVARVRMRGA